MSSAGPSSGSTASRSQTKSEGKSSKRCVTRGIAIVQPSRQNLDVLIDWPDEKRELYREFERAMERHRMSSAPVAMQVPHVILDEGSSIRMQYPDGRISEIGTSPHEASFTLSRDELLKGRFEPSRAAESLGRTMGEGMEKALVEKIKELKPSSGGTFGGADLNEFRTEFLKRLEEMHVDFDEEGKPSVVIVISPEMAERWSEIATPEFLLAGEKLFEKKKNEWAFRETHRRLAD